ncbi:hypothetical protein [Serratia quinivorans]|uniref:hypothetical protein n=1 Tax=Serratia quinivorans TaxID=137545 RepID=UPI002179FB81|nr:hypothetical protein [Serratia quinivorans]CAI1087703.1 Uncharacterised protein [Serratia quinivorans]
MKTIKLMADYYSFPLWEASPGEFGNIDPESLPLSDALKEELIKWSEKYDSILNDEDPLLSGFKSEEEEKRFIDDGYKLAHLLQEELGYTYNIIYHSEY